MTALLTAAIKDSGNDCFSFSFLIGEFICDTKICREQSDQNNWQTLTSAINQS